MKPYDRSLRRFAASESKDRSGKRTRRQGPIGRRYMASGFAIETWAGSQWIPIEFFPDAGSMRRMFRIRRRATSYPFSHDRMRFPCDDKSPYLPAPQWDSQTRPAVRGVIQEAYIPRPYFTCIQAAMEDGATVLLVYRDAKGDKTRRRVRPEEWAGELLFVAFCELREAYRSFRMDRILDCQMVS